MSLEQWLSPDRITPLVNVSKIDRVPVSFVVAIGDKLCPPILHERWFAQVTAPDSHIRFERGGHLIFYFKADDAFMRRMVQTIETGRAEEDDGGETSGFLELITTQIIRFLFY